MESGSKSERKKIDDEEIVAGDPVRVGGILGGGIKSTVQEESIPASRKEDLAEQALQARRALSIAKNKAYAQLLRQKARTRFLQKLALVLMLTGLLIGLYQASRLPPNEIPNSLASNGWFLSLVGAGVAIIYTSNLQVPNEDKEVKQKIEDAEKLLYELDEDFLNYFSRGK